MGWSVSNPVIRVSDILILVLELEDISRYSDVQMFKALITRGTLTPGEG